MGMPGRKYEAASGYRYGFNGKENDNEVKGQGNQQDYGMRIYDPRLGRFLSVDPISEVFPWNSTYSYAEGDVARCIDLDGLEKLIKTINKDKYGRIKSMSIAGVRDKELKQPQDVNLKYPNKSRFTSGEVVIVETQDGKGISKRSRSLNSKDLTDVANALVDNSSFTDDESLPEGKMAMDYKYGNQLVKGDSKFDVDEFDFFYTENKYTLSKPIEKEFVPVAFIPNIRMNSLVTVSDRVEAINKTVTRRIDEFKSNNPQINSLILTDITLSGNAQTTASLEAVKKELKEKHKIEVKIKTDPTVHGSNFHLNMKVSGAKQ